MPENLRSSWLNSDATLFYHYHIMDLDLGHYEMKLMLALCYFALGPEVFGGSGLPNFRHFLIYNYDRMLERNAIGILDTSHGRRW